MTPNDTGYYLVDGARRRLALQQLGRGEAPCVIRDSSDEVEQLIDAVTANVQREDLTIVEEARAFAKMRSQGKPVKQIAAELGVAQKLVSQRLAMLTLPEYVLKLVASGALAPGHIPTLVEMTKVSPNLATGVATKVVELDIPVSRFIANPFERIALGHDPDLGIWVVSNTPSVAIASVRKNLDEVTLARLKEIGELDGTDVPNAVTINLQAAQSFGSVYSAPEDVQGWDRKHAICDPAWVVGAVSDTIAELVKRARKDAKQNGDTVGPAPAATAEPITEEQVKEARREERQAELKARLASNAVNLNLGAELFTHVAALVADRELALTIARLVIRDDARDLYLAGLHFCDPATVKEVAQKNGAAKLEYELPNREQQAQKVWDFIERGETAGQVFGRLFQVLGMAGLCDQTTVAQSSRPGRPRIAQDAAPLVAEWLGTRLPVPILERLSKEAEAKATYDADQAERRAKYEDELREAEDADEDEALEREHDANHPQDDE